MRESKIRFGSSAWTLIQEEAEIDGVSASQFVREAALARALYHRARRGETGEGYPYTVEDLIERLRAEDSATEEP